MRRSTRPSPGSTPRARRRTSSSTRTCRRTSWPWSRAKKCSDADVATVPAPALRRERPPPDLGAIAARRRTLLWQIGVGLALIVAWQLAAALFGDRWISRPTLVAVRLWSWLGGDLYRHLATTLAEVFAGIGIGLPIGAALGLWLGRSPFAGSLLRPFVVALYSIP